MAAGPEILYYCYNCERTVELASPDCLTCADCHSDFIEEHPSVSSLAEEPALASESAASEIEHMDPGFGQLLRDMSSFLSHVQVASSGLDNENGPQILRLGTDARALSPVLLLQGRTQNLLDLSVGDYATNDGEPLRIPGTIGDYFVGPGFEHLIHEVAENDLNKYGPPPASKSAVDGLPTIVISSDNVQGADVGECTVCKEAFELLSQAKQLPCNHIYHPNCILPWLGQHNSCPICRYELPTDDPDYERSRARRIAAEELSENQ